MELWNFWISLLQSALTYISMHFGVSQAMAVILLTLLARSILMPVSLTSAIRIEKSKKQMKLFKPQLDALRETYKDDPAKMASETMRIYSENKVRLLDRLAIANIGAQGIFGIGIFQALGKASFSSKFLWISSLAKPDFLLTIVVGALMLLGMALMPGATAEQSMLIMMAVSVVVAAITISTLPSAVGVYWAASNAFTVAQALVLRMVVSRQGREEIPS
jgi:YidC/Oxa1 family membrane protein insertase